jgi:voltage-gated potassium channel
MTTVGYGDKFPTTDAGRLIGAALMIMGVGLVGTFAGFVASWFHGGEQKKQEIEIHELRDEIRSLREALDKQNPSPDR